MSALPNIPDMSNWSMIDFELAFDGVQMINNSSTYLMNQPRAGVTSSNYHRGAQVIVQVGEQWCSSMLTAIVEALEERRFRDADEDDRRLRLLLCYHCSWGSSGEPLTEILRRLSVWQLPPQGGAR